MTLHKDGRPQAVLWGSPAWEAGPVRQTQVVAINGRVYKAERMADAVRANVDGKAPLQLLFARRRCLLDGCHRLPRWPALPAPERLPGTPERLDTGVLKAR